MTNTHPVIGAFCLATLLAQAVALGADPAPSELDRLRSALRDVTIQLRTAQAELASAQAMLGTSEDQRKQAEARVEALQKQAEAERSSSKQTIADLNQRLQTRSAENGKISTELSLARTEWTKAAGQAKAAEEECRRLSDQNAEQRKRILILQAKNTALFLTANDILTHLSDFSFGNALKAKEPFVGSARAKLETLVQDYQDKITDERDKP